MEKKSFKVLVSGIVRSNFMDKETGKRVIAISISPKVAEFIEDRITSLGMRWHGDHYPIKTDTDSGELYLSCKSKYDIQFDCAVRDTTIDDLGRDSTVAVRCIISEGVNQRKPFVSAYVIAVTVKDFHEREIYDAFSDDSFEEVPFE